MFGYVVVNEEELKIKDYRKYRGYYCGLCQTLKREYGRSGQLTVSFDMTFLVLLLTALYEPNTDTEVIRCIAHPFATHPIYQNQYSQYVADMNVLLSYLKCMDDWEDEKKIAGLLFGKTLKKKSLRVQKKYEEKIDLVIKAMKCIRKCEESDDSNMDLAAGYFGEVMAELFVYQKDIWEESLRRCGFFLGKFIYLMDAYEDIEKDIKTGNYNVLKALYADQETFEEQCKSILTMMMAECSKAFEMLPIIEETAILRNILYSGVWMRYQRVRQDRKDRKTKNGSI